MLPLLHKTVRSLVDVWIGRLGVGLVVRGRRDSYGRHPVDRLSVLAQVFLDFSELPTVLLELLLELLVVVVMVLHFEIAGSDLSVLGVRPPFVFEAGTSFREHIL